MFYRSGWLRCVGFKCIGLCFVLVYRYLRFGVRVGVDVWCLCYYILLYYILYSSSSSLPFPIYLSLFLFYLLLFYLPFPLLLPPLPSIPFLSSSSSHSFYTCRHFLTVIYIPQESDPACFIGVDG